MHTRPPARTHARMQVKECLTAARAGREYTVKHESPASQLNAGGSTARSLSETGGVAVAAHDADDLSLRSSPEKAPGEEPAATRAAEDGAGVNTHRIIAEKPAPRRFGLLQRLSTVQALGLWVLVVLACLTIVPKLFGMRRRKRSGMRTE